MVLFVEPLIAFAEGIVVKFFMSQRSRFHDVLRRLFVPAIVVGAPLLLAACLMHLWSTDLSIPLSYSENGLDDVWQLILTKALVDNGWVFTNHYLAAPAIAQWYVNPAAQTSALHSVLMLAISKIQRNAVEVQQIYLLLNFSLISLTSFLACRMLKISRLPAVCIGILFSFSCYRFQLTFYAFLANYFVVPLALVSVFWIAMGEFVTPGSPSSIGGRRDGNTRKSIFFSWKFLCGLSFVILIAVTDGYYAFFTLLLLGCATALRIFSGDYKRPLNLVSPLIYIVSLMVAALALAHPLNAYKANHPEQFSPNGIEDSSLVKHAFEAEVYSVSLKLMLAPSPAHRIAALGHLGARMIGTSDAARKYRSEPTVAALGMLGSVLLLGTFLLIAIPALRDSENGSRSLTYVLQKNKLLWTAAAFALFSFLCSISGGIGTLVALIYPTIRAYDRFPLFLLFFLYVGAGAIVTALLDNATARKRKITIAITLIVTCLSLGDQIPADVLKRQPGISQRFLAERAFVQSVEKALPSGAMVYQYPFSQWMSNSPYYGWGSMAQIRLYLHSSQLHWSNGADKNTPIDDWGLHISELPINQLLTEVEAAGFKAVVVDRNVVGPEEYARVRDALMKRSRTPPLEDKSSNLAFFKLDDPGYRVVYDPSYRSLSEVVVSNPSKAIAGPVSTLIDASALQRFVRNNPATASLVITKREHPEIFNDAATSRQGSGDTPLSPTSLLQGDMTCVLAPSTQAGQAADQIDLSLTNRSAFPWTFNTGKFPLRIGVHLLNSDGSLQQWDSGFRVNTDMGQLPYGNGYRGQPLTLANGKSLTLHIPLSALNLDTHSKVSTAFLNFEMLQDGYAWFSRLSCKVPLKQ